MSSVPPLDAAGGEGGALVKVQNGEAEVIGSTPRPLSLARSPSHVLALSHTLSRSGFLSHRHIHNSLAHLLSRALSERLRCSARPETNQIGLDVGIGFAPEVRQESVPAFFSTPALFLIRFTCRWWLC